LEYGKNNISLYLWNKFKASQCIKIHIVPSQKQINYRNDATTCHAKWIFNANEQNVSLKTLDSSRSPVYVSLFINVSQ